MAELRLNVKLVRARIPNLNRAAKRKGIRRTATISDLINGKTRLGQAKVETLVQLAEMAGCKLDELIVRENPIQLETFAESLQRWSQAGDGSLSLGPVDVQNPLPEEVRIGRIKRLPRSHVNPPLPPLHDPLEA